jgi:hypothetical protein
MVLSRQGRDGGDRLGGYQGRAAECKRAGLSWVKCKGPTTACHARRRRFVPVARALAHRLEVQLVAQIEDRRLAGADGIRRNIREDQAAPIAVLPDRPCQPRRAIALDAKLECIRSGRHETDRSSARRKVSNGAFHEVRAARDLRCKQDAPASCRAAFSGYRHSQTLSRSLRLFEAGKLAEGSRLWLKGKGL